MAAQKLGDDGKPRKEQNFRKFLKPYIRGVAFKKSKFAITEISLRVPSSFRSQFSPVRRNVDLPVEIRKILNYSGGPFPLFRRWVTSPQPRMIAIDARAGSR